MTKSAALVLSFSMFYAKDRGLSPVIFYAAIFSRIMLIPPAMAIM